MKTRSIIYSMLCALLISGSLTGCSSDDDMSQNDEGSKVEQLPVERVFILNEGAWQANNAGITLYDPNGRVATIGDIYSIQNGKRLGDTGQDIIEYDDHIYVVVAGSKYIAKLNEAGVELARYAFTEAQGDPRYMAAEDGKIYVTLYSGNVARFDAQTLAFEKMVKVGNNPEQIIEKDDKLYLLNSGWGSDNRLSIIDIRTFDTAEHVEVFTNPDQIVEVGNQIIIQGYGAAYDYPVAVFDPVKKSYKQIGQGSIMAAYGNTLYVIYSETDWNTNATINHYYSYNAMTGQVNNSSFLKDAPAELTNTSIYMLSINDDNGDIYIGTSDYVTNGDVYRFRNDGTLIEKFESGGVSPNKAIFVD